ncbi:MAG: protein kinase domain-containing protein [Solirubrobacterales bacterium]
MANPLIGTTLSGRYVVESKLGSGGMSTVFLARDDTLERWVAVKVLHREISDQPDQIQRFRREARSVAQLSHPNLVSVIDAGEDGGHPYIVFEYIEGETLKQRIERMGRLPLDESAAYAIETGRGLSAAHAARLIHRDVKPQNVLIDAEGRAKLTDFGIARELEADGLTATGRVLGTTDYVSPEQAMGHNVDARSDIYSLGVVLYEMLTGKPPFAAETLVGVAMKHVNEQMPDVQVRRPQVSSALAAVVDKATIKDPGRRYSGMAPMLDDLEEALEVEVSRAGSSTGEATNVLRSVPARNRRFLTPRRLSFAGIAIVLVGAAIALGIAALTGEEGPSREKSKETGSAPISEQLTGADDFDPPPGDEEEHSEEARLAIDNDPTTAWTTEQYSSGLAGVGKEGVGISVDAGSAVEPAELRVVTPTPGWSGEIYAANESPDDLAGWGDPVGSIANAAEDDTIALERTEPAQYYLLWITDLATNDAVEISDIRLLG